ncbi:MAG: DsbA family protein, partial [Lysobacter sp.]
FNPIAALRLCIAAGSTPQAVDAIFTWIWARGEAGDSVEALLPVAASLGIDVAAPNDEATKRALRANTDAALAEGVFGVPTLAFDGQLFWGNDTHEFALAAMRDPDMLNDAEMRRVTALPVGVVRRS